MKALKYVEYVEYDDDDDEYVEYVEYYLINNEHVEYDDDGRENDKDNNEDDTHVSYVYVSSLCFLFSSRGELAPT